MRGFMDGHTQWIEDDEEDQVHGEAAGNDQGAPHQDNNNEGAAHEDDEDEPDDPAHNDHGGEDHGGEQHVQTTEGDDRRTLTEFVQDPHVK